MKYQKKEKRSKGDWKKLIEDYKQRKEEQERKEQRGVEEKK